MFNATLIYMILLLQGFASQGSFTLESESLFTFKGELSNGEPMGTPKDVATFSDGSFALAEFYNPEIKEFNSDGTYLKTISRQGRGPGEFEEIESIFVNSKDQLLAIDHVQLKLVAFNPDDTFQEYYIFKNRPRIRSFHQTQKGSYIVGMNAFLKIGIKKNDYIFQEMNEDFEFAGNGFVTLDNIREAVIGEEVKPIIRGLKSSTDNSVLTESDDLVIAPKLYSGNMSVFRDKTSKGFSKNEFLKTGEYGRAAEEYSSSKKLDYNIVRKHGVTISSSAGSSIRYLQYNESLGLFRLNNGQIIHFIQVQEKRKPVLIVELLDKDAKRVIGVQKIDRLGDLLIEDSILEFETYGRINLGLLHLDHQNRLFIAKQDERSHPELHVVQLKLE